MSAYKAAGITYLQYTNICARALRNSLNEKLRTAAAPLNQNGLKFAKWENGRASEQKFIVKAKQ
ncbi:mitochondrial ATP synthase epsilon chain-domain-containing protein [Phycomyces blakesleeanus]|uniref:Mitochondrial ATP synthase epsilon chain-domain-containing protein n=1 Tax=Phycomyces blakesleeanus TaxID=4837 RepID=A0ABR3APB6_PHYBL